MTVQLWKWEDQTQTDPRKFKICAGFELGSNSFPARMHVFLGTFYYPKGGGWGDCLFAHLRPATGLNPNLQENNDNDTARLRKWENLTQPEPREFKKARPRGRGGEFQLLSCKDACLFRSPLLAHGEGDRPFAPPLFRSAIDILKDKHFDF